LRSTAVAVSPDPRRHLRLPLGLLALAATALVALAPAAAPAVADDPSAATEGAATAATEVTLRKGDRGRAVRKLQRKLGVAADGVFGPQTDRAVKRFQRRNGLTVDGIVGPMTRGKLGLARFSSADVRHPPKKEAEAPAGDDGDSAVKLPRVLREIAECESGGDPRAVSSNGLYRGKFQFSRETWKAVGGRGSDPAKASEAHQDRMALRLYRQQGVAPWPACGARATS
jgi:peptidoglycan hydrolase-like protein with peptidoglycan-binding domain